MTMRLKDKIAQRARKIRPGTKSRDSLLCQKHNCNRQQSHRAEQRVVTPPSYQSNHDRSPIKFKVTHSGASLLSTRTHYERVSLQAHDNANFRDSINSR